MDTDELSLIKKLLVLWDGRKIIAVFTLVLTIAATIYAFYLPPIYKAECYFLPPNQDMNRISSLTGNMMGNITANTVERIGGVADLAGLPTTVTGGQMILGILKRNAIIDVIIERFDLMNVYEQKYKSKMRDKLLKDILETNEDSKSGMITIGVLDENPERAANMANAFIEVLQAKMLDLSLIEAVQRRVFFEEQLEKSREALNKAEAEMLDYQNQLGVAMPQSQMEARLNSITELQRQIAAQNVEISALSTYATPDNPKLKVARSQLNALTEELRRLEREQREANPQLGVEYQRYAMNLRLATTTYEVVMKQFENACVDEAQGFFPLQVVDYASVPDFKFKPSKARIIIVGMFGGFVLGCLVVVSINFVRGFRERIRELEEDGGNDDDD